MFDFEKELQAFKPILEVDDIEQAISDNEMKDMIDMMREIILEEKDR